MCSPNYLHDAHCRLALRVGANVICEKPLVINPWNLDPLQELEHETGGRINTVLQLRLHPQLLRLREVLRQEQEGRQHDVSLTYITSRGNWYQSSWVTVHGFQSAVACIVPERSFVCVHQRRRGDARRSGRLRSDVGGACSSARLDESAWTPLVAFRWWGVAVCPESSWRYQEVEPAVCRVEVDGFVNLRWRAGCVLIEGKK